MAEEKTTPEAPAAEAAAHAPTAAPLEKAMPKREAPEAPKDWRFWAAKKKPAQWALEAARRLHRSTWVEGAELTEEQFDKGIATAAGWPSK